MKVAAPELLAAYRGLVEELGAAEAAELYHRLFRSRWTAYAFALLSTGARVSAADLVDLGVPIQSAYRALNELERLGLSELAELVQVSRGGGPRTRVWRLRRGG